MSQESDFNDDSPIGWIQWFCSLDDHAFFCEINEEFIRQPFNLYGLHKQIKNFNKALEMIVKNRAPLEEQIQDKEFLELYQQATQLYGLIHARYIASPEGLAIMRQRYLVGKFGTCPRVLCEKQNVLPIGISESCKIARVKVYCPRCKDIFSPKKKFADVDGAYFGTSFPHLLLMTYPDIRPQFSKEEFTPIIYGFKIQAEPESKKVEIESEEKNKSEIDRKLKSEIATSSETKGRKKKKKN